MNNFWNKVIKCHHIYHPNYIDNLTCNTPYCSGYEVHCAQCGVYITKCDCGYLNGISGWPEKRWRKFSRKQEKKT